MAAPEGYKALGKIGISYKGDYNPNTVYERLDAVYHNGSTYLAIKDAPDGAPRNDKINWIYLAKVWKRRKERDHCSAGQAEPGKRNPCLPGMCFTI